MDYIRRLSCEMGSDDTGRVERKGVPLQQRGAYDSDNEAERWINECWIRGNHELEDCERFEDASGRRLEDLLDEVAYRRPVLVCPCDAELVEYWTVGWIFTDGSMVWLDSAGWETADMHGRTICGSVRLRVK